MVDPDDYFGPAPEKLPPTTEEDRVAAFKAIKAKFAAADPEADINRIIRRAQKKADEAKTASTKIRHLGLAIDDIGLLRMEHLADHPMGDHQVGSEEYFASMAFADAVDRAIIRLRQAIAHLELEPEETSSPESESYLPENPPPTEKESFPEQMEAEQVARYIHRNKDVVYRYAREGKIPTIWIDSHPLFSKSDIDKWLDQHKKPSKER